MSKHWEPSELAAVVEPHFVAAVEAGQAPGLSYGIVHDGQLVVRGGLGCRVPGDARTVPDERSVFRIASMTKSFTAATALSLRDDGLLSLDEPVHHHVPELLAGGRAARTITVRHLLTMGAGFLTDDPWGDRQQDLPIDAFRALLASGVSPVLDPGERFEYSNLGYAVLGLVLESVTAMPFADVVDMRLLAPLGLRATGFTPPSDADFVPGFVRRSTGWVDEPAAAHGAFSPMGGLYSSVADLARWVAVFQPGSTISGLPLSEISLREMQRTQRLVGASVGTAADQPPVVTGYGFGLFEEFGPAGRFVFHSGGYPGYGSHMRWHPASGLGIVALANSTYAPMSTVAGRALQELVQAVGVPLHVEEPLLPGLERAEKAVVEWLAAATPDGPEGETLRTLFADNVERDMPWSERLVQWRRIRDDGDPVVRSTSRPSPGSAVIELGSDAPRWRVTVMVAPHDPLLVQAVAVRERVEGSPGSGVSTVLS